MKIIYHGHSCFEVIGEFSICLDPFGKIGIKLPQITTDYYFCSHEHFDHNAHTSLMGKSAYGEKGFEFSECYHDEEFGLKRGKNKIIKFKMGGFTVAHLGDIGEYDSDKVVDFLKDADILMIPVGSVYTINARGAMDYVDKIKPKIVIPMHFKTPGCSVEVESVEKFLNLAKDKYTVLDCGHEFEPINYKDTHVCVLKKGEL